MRKSFCDNAKDAITINEKWEEKYESNRIEEDSQYNTKSTTDLPQLSQSPEL